jgi:hypothetical protein
MEAMKLKNDLLLLPAGFGQWMSIARQGIYNDLIAKTRSLVARDEFDEAEILYRQATDMRLMGGYTVHRHKDENIVEDGIRQHQYDQYVEEGLQYLERNEADLALYYLNKAWALQDEYLLKPSKSLQGYRMEAANWVIEGMLSEAKFKAWAFEFEEARNLTDQIAAMLMEYRIPAEDLLYTRYQLLHEELYAKGCEKAKEHYDQLMSEVFSRREAGDYTGARRMAQAAVDYSMQHLECHIRDEQAWYQKILLEPLAQFEDMERNMMRKTIGEPDTFLTAYRDLQRFYYRNKLLEQGVSLASLYAFASSSSDAVFLKGMLDYYLQRNDLERALGISESMRQLGLPSAEYRDDHWQLGKKLAIRDAGTSNAQLPWMTMNGYTGGDSWYRRLHWGYKLNFLDRSSYAFRYWPLIWKK